MNTRVLVSAVLFMVAVATPAGAQETRPYFYVWGTFTADWEDMQAFASKMVHVYLGGTTTSGAAAADAAVLTANTQLDPTPGPQQTDAGHVSILIQNFGMWQWQEEPPTPPATPTAWMLSFIHEDDELDSPGPDWEGATPSNSERAFDAAMKECAYDVIQAEWPNCKVSNYGHFSSDGAVDTFGWYTGRSYTSSGASSFIPTRQCTRGWTTEVPDFYWNDFPGSLWLVVPSRASGDFAAPDLYPVSPYYFTPSDRYNYYIKPDGGGPQEIDRADASLGIARRWVESIQNSDPQEVERQPVAPWVAAPGSDKWDPPYQEREFRMTLAMLRAKAITEVLLFWPGESGNWEALLAIMDRVYVPQIQSCAALHGECDPTPCELDPDQVRYTLRTADSDDQVIQLIAGPDDKEVALKIVFNNLDDWENAPPKMFLNVECSVKPDDDEVPNVRGLIYVWDPSVGVSGSWIFQTDANDFVGTSDPGFGFFAPENDEWDEWDEEWCETRRTFQLNSGAYISPTGEMEVKIVLRRPYPGDFAARYDLTQLVGTLEVDSGGGDGLAQGADDDYSFSVDSADAAEFMADFTAARPAADFNNDGSINLDDVSDFNTAYNNPP